MADDVASRLGTPNLGWWPLATIVLHDLTPHTVMAACSIKSWQSPYTLYVLDYIPNAILMPVDKLPDALCRLM